MLPKKIIISSVIHHEGRLLATGYFILKEYVEFTLHTQENSSESVNAITNNSGY